MNGWLQVKLGTTLTRVRDAIDVNDLEEYKRITIRMDGKGITLRDRPLGSSIGTKRQFIARDGQFVLSKIDARNGAFGVLPGWCDGAIVTGNFWVFSVDHTKLLPEFLNYLSKSESFVSTCKRLSDGTTNRRYLQETAFLRSSIPLPSVAEQQCIAARLDALADKTRQLTTHLDAIEAAADQLLAQRFQKAIADAPYRPMAEVAPLVRRQVVINIETDYPELGVRSFGKGTFHKPALSGADAGTKRLFGIEPGDLIFSNVFAWEGAIAIANADDGGRYGSHRFMTCATNHEMAVAEFLLYYLLSPEGIEKVREASPGGAGRNRTLGVKKLEKLTVPVPSSATQRVFVAVQTKVNDLKAQHARIRAANADLLPAALERLFSA